MPHAEYTRRLAERQAAAARWAQQDHRLANARLAVAIAGLLLGWLALGPGLFSPRWLAVPALLFLALLVLHDRVIHAGARARRAVAFYEAGLRRLEDRWAGAGRAGEAFLEPSHPYAVDLDLFGRGSLFELLCTCRTAAGEACLAGWLLAPAEPEMVRARQAAVAELRPRLDLREELALLGEETQPAVDAGSLAEWGTAPPRLASRSAHLLAGLLAAGNVAALIAWVLGYGFAPFLGLLLLEQLFGRSQRLKVRQVLEEAEGAARHLSLLAPLLARLERSTFTAPRLQALQATLRHEGVPPSVHVARLQRLIDLAQMQQNQIVALLAVLLLIPTHLAFAIERWRARHGPHVPDWQASIAEFETLSSLAACAYEHPADPFPELLDEGAHFAAEALGHPLLPEASSVRNDLSLGEQHCLLIVSGSNMSGKSTLLRTVGVNTVLALAGAPVRARRLRLSPLAIGASIRVQDSLQAGASRFYAEITRLRRIVELAAGPHPALFLLDEILHGTNSHDRRIGAEAVLRVLVERGALGLATTHDLALTEIAADPALRAANVHFQDDLTDGRIIFDYRLRPGIVQHSNALALMRAVGLEV
jgi:hypothetical protein